MRKRRLVKSRVYKTQIKKVRSDPAFSHQHFNYETGPWARSYEEISKRLPFVLENPRVSVLPCGNKFV
jgi:hypothetical protein